MTRDELNQAVHRAMGHCVLELPFKWKEMDGDKLRCLKCGILAKKHPRTNSIPDYCSENTPRRYLNELEAFVIETKSFVEFGEALRSVMGATCEGPNRCTASGATASAEQRVRACAKALGLEEG